MTHDYPAIVFVGAHQESQRPLQFLLESGERVVGLVTRTSRGLARMSGGVDLTADAERAAVPVLRVKHVNHDASIRWIRELKPDLLLVIGWTQLLSEELLRIPSVACLGFHASLLPRYRGRAPINWALIHGERETGNTLMVLVPGADEGDIVAQRRIEITDQDDCRTLYDRVAATEVEMLAEVLPLVRQGSLPRRKQQADHATVMPQRRPEDGRIDWRRSTRELYNWVRALTHPYPGGFSELDGEVIRIWTAAMVDDVPRPTVAPGTVSIDEQGWPRVATNDGWLRLLRVQRDGEDELSGSAAAGSMLRTGQQFAAPADRRES